MNFWILSLVVLVCGVGVTFGAPVDNGNDDGYYHPDQDYKPEPVSLLISCNIES